MHPGGQRLCRPPDLGCLRPERAHLFVPDFAGGADAAYGLRSGGVLSGRWLFRYQPSRQSGFSARSWPRWTGFTPAEFERLDFSRIDLGEFIAEVTASVRVPTASSIGQRVRGTVKQRVNSYYNR